MYEFFGAYLREVERKIPTALPAEIPGLFEGIPIDLFGRLYLHPPADCPNIRAFLPGMPSEEVQRNWAGADSYTLMLQSLSAIKTIVLRYEQVTGRNIRDATVLDFGCGWGRLTRLLYKYTSIENLYGVDPWDSSLEECRKHGLRIHLAKSEDIPTTLPFKQKFDLMFAFSIFTHLSEKTAHAVMKTLRLSIAEQGMLLFTVRPVEFWDFFDGGKAAPAIRDQHDKTGFAFRPHARPAVGGELTFGDTSMSLEYIRDHFPDWKIACVDWNMGDPYQMLVSLRPV